MSRNLIVYYSRCEENYVSGKIINLKIGNTKVVAQKLIEILDADIVEIKPIKPYPFNYHECTEVSKQEQSTNQRPAIEPMNINVDDYDDIYLGYPNWWSTMPMCVWTFLESVDLSGKRIHPFCTHEGSGLGKSIKDLKKLCPNSQIMNGLSIYGSAVQQSDKEISKWLKEI